MTTRPSFSPNRSRWRPVTSLTRSSVSASPASAEPPPQHRARRALGDLDLVAEMAGELLAVALAAFGRDPRRGGNTHLHRLGHGYGLEHGHDDDDDGDHDHDAGDQHAR